MAKKRKQWMRVVGLACVLLYCVACAESSATQPQTTELPTLVVPPTRTPTVAAPITQATASAAAPTASSAATSQAISPTSVIPVIPTTNGAATISADFQYLWPTYLPANMALFRKETRIPKDDESGVDNLGFFLLTFSDGQGKIFFGGGSTDVIPLTGAAETTETLTIAGRSAVLTTAKNQALLDITLNKGKLFLFGWNIDGETLVQVAESLQPIDLEVLRQVVESHQ